MDPDPAIFVIDLQDANKKKSQNSRNRGFSYYFFLMIEGSGGPKTYGSGGSEFGTLTGMGEGFSMRRNICTRILNKLSSGKGSPQWPYLGNGR